MIKNVLLSLLVTLMLATACSQQTEYERMVQKEQKKGIMADSLFLGYTFGMSKQEFYEHSRSLNQQHKVFQGQRAASMRYDDVEGLKHRAYMFYFAEFNDDKIYKMPVRYAYNGWAPWNRDLWSDSLLTNLVTLNEQRYNRKFIYMKHPELDVQAYITVIGNKRIAIFKADDKEVALNYVDLSALPDEKNL